MDESASPTQTAEQPASRFRLGLWLLGIILAVNLLDLVSRSLAAGPAASSYEKILSLVQAGVCGLLFLLLAGAAVGLRLRVRATPATLPLPCRYERTTPMSLDLN
jgi:hypothetical protein